LGYLFRGVLGLLFYFDVIMGVTNKASHIAPNQGIFSRYLVSIGLSALFIGQIDFIYSKLRKTWELP